MLNYRALTALLATLFFTPMPLIAAVILIPQDEASIQDACDNSNAGDTLRISAGSWDESVLVIDKHFTIEGDTAHPEDHVISPTSGGSALMILGEIQGQMVIRGLTFTGGTGFEIEDTTYGGGIYCQGTSPYPLSLERCIISNNRASIGGACYIEGMAITMSLCRVEDNYAENNGVMFINQPVGDSQSGLTWTVIARNRSEDTILLLNLVDEIFLLRNCTVTENESENWLIQIITSQIDVQGTILWNNDSHSIFDSDYQTILIFRYSLIQGGRQAISGDIDQWTGEMLTVSPGFSDPENHDYTLSKDSPCIDRGYPYPTLDFDGSRSDMGAFPYTHTRGFILTLRDRRDNNPIVGARAVVITPRRFELELISDENGSAGLFGFPDNGNSGEFAVSIEHPDFIDRRFTFQFHGNDTTYLNFYLSPEEFEINPPQLELGLVRGEQTIANFTIRNNSEIGLNWQICNDQEYSVQSQFDIGEFGRVEAAAFDGDNFYLADCYADGDRSVFVLNREGMLIGQFRQPYQAGTGFRSMDWADDSLWAAGDRTIYRLSADGRVARSFSSSITATGIVWDTDAEVVRIVGLYSSIISYDAAGNRLDAVILRKVRVHHGISWYPDDPQGYKLYILTSGENDDSKVIVKLNTQTGDTLMVGKVDDREGISIGTGMNTTTRFDEHGKPIWLLFSVDSTLGAPTRQLSVVKFNSSEEWLTPFYAKGYVAPNAQLSIVANIWTILGASDTLDAGDYETELTVLFDLPSETISIPVRLHVAPNHIGSANAGLSPEIFSLLPPYPNPFNSTVNIEFTLLHEESVELAIYDLNGKIIEQMSGGRFSAGKHQVGWNAKDSPTGLYLLAVKAGASTYTQKLMLIK